MRRHLWVFLLFLFGCTAPHPYYCTTNRMGPPTDESERDALVYTLEQAFQKGKIRSLEVVTPAGRYKVHPKEKGAPSLQQLPLAALEGAFSVVDKSYAGAEWDMLIPTRENGLVPVTVVRELKGDVVVSMGDTLSAPELPLMTPDELAAKYETGPLVAGDSQWSGIDLYYLDYALRMLTPEERAVLQGTTFIRNRQLAERQKGRFFTVAYYHQKDGETTIEIFDTIRRSAATSFTGEPTAPHPAGAMSVLHEVGHALDFIASVVLLREHRRLVTRYNETVDKLNQHKFVSEETQRLEADLTTQKKAMDDLGKRTLQQEKDRTLLTTYLALRGKLKGPTEYGATAPEESFAEAFALFHTDPAALRRIYPAVHDWFARGGHLQVLSQTLGSLTPRPKEASKVAQVRTYRVAM